MEHAQRTRQRELGYIAAAKIDEASMDIEDVICETRKLINQPSTSEERYMRLGKILDAAYQARAELKSIPRK
jgi:hypothetical protein